MPVLGSSELRREQTEELHAAVNAALRREQRHSQIAEAACCVRISLG
jgi:hypothetical protein